MNAIIPALIATTVCITAPAFAETTAITESDVRKTVSQLTELVKQENYDGFAKYISEDAVINMNVDMGGEKASLTANKADYLANLKAGQSQVERYRYDVSIDNIAITDGAATVNSTVTETFKMMEMPMTSVAKEVTTFKLIDDALKITKLDADGVVTVDEEAVK